MMFFITCPRGFANERWLWCFESRDVADKVLAHEGEVEEVDEQTAKMHYFKKVYYPAAPAVLEYATNLKLYPNWEEAKQIMLSASSNYSK